eukprot:TRINITY_DN13695_c0_g1_i3.p1 TRINITY_DN13695_c0_g1~~TRINITY_DN13695_c0_g1_i3.p1  ORF type:complete len:236 (+),score=57.68 TRINITY_DN13695_c0_g1_i3:64-771(+)
MASSSLPELAAKAISVHGIGAGSPPVKAELWQEFTQRPACEQCSSEIVNDFYAGTSHEEVDWSKPVFAIFVDFKGDSLQLSSVLEMLHGRIQYVFVGNPLPFNDGWHFSAVNDFEHPQQKLDFPSYENKRVWHRVNYVLGRTETGEVGLIPREKFTSDKEKAAENAKNALPISSSCKFATLIFTGGIMPHTLIATALANNDAYAACFLKHLELGATFATAARPGCFVLTGSDSLF